MRKENYVCTTHRVASRSNDMWDGSTHCPVDGAPMVKIGTRWRVPKKTDDVGWKGVQKFISEQQYQREWRNERVGGPLWKLYDAEKLLKWWKR